MLRQGVCRFYTGVVNKTCQQGIAYTTFHGQALPCFRPRPPDTHAQAICSLRSLPTAEEAAADEARLHAELHDYFTTYQGRQERGECGICGIPMRAKVQVGRCIYVEPCGCRVGQGQLMQHGKRVQRIEVATS
jgi:hypothetical protein